jgi:hypothetical protein
MTYNEAMELISFLNNRMRKMHTPWYQWAVFITWEKLERWASMLGYKEVHHVR